jgi:hypothetical protein
MHASLKQKPLSSFHAKRRDCNHRQSVRFMRASADEITVRSGLTLARWSQTDFLTHPDGFDLTRTCGVTECRAANSEKWFYSCKHYSAFTQVGSMRRPADFDADPEPVDVTS